MGNNRSASTKNCRHRRGIVGGARDSLNFRGSSGVESLDAVRKMIEIALNPTTDSRTAFRACKAIIELAFRPAAVSDANAGPVAEQLDFSVLSDAELREWRRLMIKIAPDAEDDKDN